MSPEFFVTALIVVLIPGTGVVFTIATGLARGRVAGVFAAFGCTLGIVPHIVASVLGLAAILHTSALLFQGLKYAGAAYLIYLAIQTLRERGPISFRHDNVRRSMAGVVRTGFLINILNPKLSIFFLAFLPQFVPAGANGALIQMLVLGGIFMAMTFGVFVVYGVFAAWAGQKMLGSASIMGWMRRTTALVFGGLGLRLALAER
ncbi:MAG TPA: LysE family translocator [Devosia sp.]|nr:LysE family translocator [Devosia sp.]